MMPKGHVVRKERRLDIVQNLASVFDGLKVLGPYTARATGRRFVTFGSGGCKYGTIMHYARFVWMNHYNRVPPDGYDVDHIDGDRTNDNIENLQLLSKDANRMKYQKGRTGTYVILRCPQCEVLFTNLKAHTYLGATATSKYSCCSVSCATSIKNKYPKGSIDGFVGNYVCEFTAKNVHEALHVLKNYNPITKE